MLERLRRSHPPRAATSVAPARLPEDTATGGPHAGGEHPDRAALTELAVLWSAAPSLSPTEPFHGSGKYVAGAEWTRAMLEYGTASRINIFASIATVDHHRTQFVSGQDSTRGSARPAPTFLPDSELSQRLGASPCDVLHRPLDVMFQHAAYARSRFSRKLFPITCSQHGISYAKDLYLCWIGLLSAPIQPCDAIVCLTQCSRQAMENRLNDIAQRYCRAWGQPVPRLPRLEVIPWGVDIARFVPRDQRLARRDLGLPLEEPIVLCVGRVQIQDKMDWTPLLLAFQEVSQAVRGRRPFFVIAGSCHSDYGQQLLAQAGQLGLAGRIRSFFNLPPASLPSLYAACDVFVSPADTPTESFGLTIVEAMACGRPVVASDWNGYKELIVHGETGFKVRTDWADCLGELNALAPSMAWEQEHLHVGQSVSVDIGQMSRHIVELLEHPDVAARMGQAARARAEQLYAWPAVVPLWEALWKELRAVADASPQPDPDRLDYLQPNYFQHFSHYASRIVTDATLVRLTQRGKQVLAGTAPLWLHEWAQGFLHPDLLLACLSALNASRWMGSGVPMADLLQALHRARGLSRDQALMHVMWCTKYGLVSLPIEGPRVSKSPR